MYWGIKADVLERLVFWRIVLFLFFLRVSFLGNFPLACLVLAPCLPCACSLLALCLHPVCLIFANGGGRYSEVGG